MSSQQNPQKILSNHDLQRLQQLLQQGQFSQVEQQARLLLTSFPKALPLYNLLAISQQGQGKLKEALASLRKMSSLEPKLAEVHFNSGAILTQLGQQKDAVFSYRKALQLKPDFTMAHFNLAALLQAQGLLLEAAKHYRLALKMEPGFFQALANLGTVLQLSGQLQEAECCYREVLSLQADAMGYFNLGTSLHDQGKHLEAVAAFREAVAMNSQFADAWNHLGETLRDQGAMGEAVTCYQQVLAIEPSHARANYNLGEYYGLAGKWLQAIPYFERSDFADAKERALLCYYKTRQFETFKHKFDQLVGQSKQHTSVLLATLSTHYATNFAMPDSYNFCPTPMAYVQHTCIEELVEPGSFLLVELLDDIKNLAIAERKQGRLYYGVQSAGNLLLRTEPSIQKLARLIRKKVEAYRRHFSGSRCSLIQHFPKHIEFTSSWYLRMKQSGYLTSHIHEEGWISGCVYLKLPDQQQGHEGSFAYSTDGDEYPKLCDDFPSQIVDLQVGDLVLFPSSLFHRTLPFQSDQERVCVAFDVKPG